MWNFIIIISVFLLIGLGIVVYVKWSWFVQKWQTFKKILICSAVIFLSYLLYASGFFGLPSETIGTISALFLGTIFLIGLGLWGSWQHLSQRVKDWLLFFGTWLIIGFYITGGVGIAAAVGAFYVSDWGISGLFTKTALVHSEKEVPASDSSSSSSSSSSGIKLSTYSTLDSSYKFQMDRRVGLKTFKPVKGFRADAYMEHYEDDKNYAHIVDGKKFLIINFSTDEPNLFHIKKK